MNVEYPLRKLPHEPRRKQAHVAGQDDELDFGLGEGGGDAAVVLLALQSLAGHDERWQAARLRGGHAGGLGLVADDDGNLGGERTARDVVRDGDEVGAAPGEQDAESSHEGTSI